MPILISEDNQYLQMLASTDKKGVERQFTRRSGNSFQSPLPVPIWEN